MLWLPDVNIGFSWMPVLCSFQRALRIKTKPGVPVSGLELISKEECWHCTCYMYSMSYQLQLVLPHSTQEQGKLKHCGYGTDLSKFMISRTGNFRFTLGLTLRDFQPMPTGESRWSCWDTLLPGLQVRLWLSCGRTNITLCHRIKTLSLNQSSQGNMHTMCTKYLIVIKNFTGD